MSLDTMGPNEDDFLSVYLDKAYRKAKTLIIMAKAVGVGLDELAQWARDDVNTIEFKLSLMEQKYGSAHQIGR